MPTDLLAAFSSTLTAANERLVVARTSAEGVLAERWARGKWMALPLGMAFAVRFGLFFLGSVAFRLLAAGPFPGALAIWNRWDAVWYVGIAQNGYYYSPIDQSSANFFPLLPSLIWLLGQPLRLLGAADPYLWAGMLISWAAFLAAAVILYRLVLARFDSATAYGTVLLLSIYPFGYFFGAPYTESIFLLLVLLTFLALEQHRWWPAGLAALLASATRSPGLILWICIALAYGLDWWERGKPIKLAELRNALALALPPLGTIAYMVYCWWVFDAPLAYVTTSEIGWQRGHLRLDGLLQGIQLLAQPWTWIGMGDLKLLLFGIYAVLTVAFLGSLPAIWRMLGPVYTLYAVAGMLLPILTTTSMVSQGRYLSVVFPTFIVTAYSLRDRPLLREALVIAGAVLLTLFSILFVLNFEVY